MVKTSWENHLEKGASLGIVKTLRDQVATTRPGVKMLNVRHLDGSVGKASALSSSCDPRVLGLRGVYIGLSREPSLSLSLSLSLSPFIGIFYWSSICPHIVITPSAHPIKCPPQCRHPVTLLLLLLFLLLPMLMLPLCQINKIFFTKCKMWRWNLKY